MYCIDCPYIRVWVEESVSGYSETDLGMVRVGNLIPAKYFCVKTGSKIYAESICFDEDTDKPERKKQSRKKKRNKRERDLRYKNHLRFLVRHFDGQVGAYYVEGVPKPYYVRYWRSSLHEDFRYLKKYSNECVRRYKGELHKGSAYKKILDYWWMCT